MPPKNSRSSRPASPAEPEIQPPGVAPKKTPNPPQPLDDDGVEGAKKDTTASSRNESGPDPMVESGVPENDPENPRETDEEKSME